MRRVVQTYGSTSTRSKQTRRLLYKNVIREIEKGNKVIMLVSAMGSFDDPYAKETLLSMVDVSSFTRQEQIRLTGISEMLSTLVCKSELVKLGYEVSTCNLEELGIENGYIPESSTPTISSEIIEEKLQTTDILICPGCDLQSATLGVSIGIETKAEKVEIYGEVKGIYTCDPRIVEDAKQLSYMRYSELLELIGSGAAILNHQCVQLAAKHNVPLHVCSCFEPGKGTYIIGDEALMKDTHPYIVSGITGSQNEARVTLVNATTANNSVGTLFRNIANAKVNVHVFNQVLVGGGKMDISFIINDQDVITIMDIIHDMKDVLQPLRTIVRSNVGKVTVVGVGIRNNHGLFQQVYNTLMENGMQVEMTSSSEISISCYINRNKANEAKTVLHKLFFETGG